MSDLFLIYVSIGSNVNRKKNIRSIINRLDSLFDRLRLSPIYETEAEGFQGQPFYNLVASFNTDQSVHELTNLLKKLEQDHGRVKQQQKFSDRTLDVDILLYDRQILHDQGIDIPRHEILYYAFVLKPLADLAPELTHPQTGKTFRQHWQEFNKTVTLNQINL